MRIYLGQEFIEQMFLLWWLYPDNYYLPNQLNSFVWEESCKIFTSTTMLNISFSISYSQRDQCLVIDNRKEQTIKGDSCRSLVTILDS